MGPAAIAARGRQRLCVVIVRACGHLRDYTIFVTRAREKNDSTLAIVFILRAQWPPART